MRVFFVLVAICLPQFVKANPPSKIKFIENRNQWRDDVHYLAQVAGGSMEIRGGGFSYYFLDHQRIEDLHHDRPVLNGFSEAVDPMIDGVHIKVSFTGSNNQSHPLGINRSKEYYNFFLGEDKSRWSSEVYAYDGFLYPSLYSGIDLKVYSTGENVKYDLIVAPGADPSVIQIQYEGMDQITIDNHDILVKTRLGEILEKKPYAFQIINGKKVTVPCDFHLNGARITFSFPSGYDPCHELVIDPLLIFSTFSGSEADNWGSTATPAENARMYSSGILNHFVQGTLSGEFPATPGVFQSEYGGLWDIGVLKYDSLGTELLYASYLGGADSEFPHSLVVNAQNELIVLGTTSSLNFPTSSNAFQTFLADTEAAPPINHVITYSHGADLFVSRISEDGKQLLASTYLGGTEPDGINVGASPLIKNYGDELRGDVITDAAGNIYVSSVTKSENLPSLNPYNGGESDALLVKLPPDLSAITWLRYLGGSDADASHTIKFDNENNIYYAGGTSSIDFPTTSATAQPLFAGDVDGWIARITNDGQTILQSTFTGSSTFDQVYFLDLNASGEVYVYGQTDGDRPISSPDIYGDPGSGQFIQKFSPDLSQQLFYTVFGSGKGSPDISPTAFLVNDCNNIYMTGWGGMLNQNNTPAAFETSTIPLQVTEDAWQKTTHGHDFYFIVLSPDAKERLYATFLGGATSRTHVDGGTSRFDKRGVVYHAVCAGCGGQDDFPTTPGVVSRTNNSRNCNNAAFKFDLSSLKALGKIKGSEYVCIPGKVEFENYSIGGEKYFWNFGDGSPILEQTQLTTVSHAYATPGTYTVWLKAYDPGTCRTSDSVAMKVFVHIAAAEFPEDDSICEGTSHTMTASGGVNYEWVSTDGVYSFNTPQVTVSPEKSTLFYVDVLEPFGCMSRDSVLLTVIPQIYPDFEFERFADCSEDMPVLKVKNLTDSLSAGDYTFFDFGDGTTSDLSEVEHVYEKPGLYNVKVVAGREFCKNEKTATLSFGPIKIPNVITPGGEDGKNDTFSVQYGDDPNATPTQFGFAVDIVIYDRWGRKVYERDNYQSDWAGADLSTGIYYFEVTVQEHSTCKGWVHLIK